MKFSFDELQKTMDYSPDEMRYLNDILDRVTKMYKQLTKEYSNILDDRTIAAILSEYTQELWANTGLVYEIETSSDIPKSEFGSRFLCRIHDEKFVVSLYR